MEVGKMKLNYKKTIFVGFAFFLICAFWQAYEAIVPIMLINKFGLNQTWSGLIMALDNVLALFMLPLFGSLSDKTKTRYGKRTPYIVIGTVVSVLLFVILSVSDYQQLNKNLKYRGIEVGSYQEAELLINQDPMLDIMNTDADDNFFQKLFAGSSQKKLSEWLTDESRIEAEKNEYLSNLEAFINGDIAFNPLMFRGVIDRDATLVEWQEYYKVKNHLHDLVVDNDIEGAKTYVNSLDQSTYGFFTPTDRDSFISIPMKTPSKSMLNIELSESDKNLVASTENILMVGAGASLNSVYSDYIATARSGYAWQQTVGNPFILIVFVAVLLVLLLSMAVYRSPAVALMPDVTLKPLRSKANAIINLMGTAGALLVLVLGIIFATGDAENALMSYIGFVLCVCIIMVGALLVFIWKVKEPKLVKEMQKEAEVYGIDEQVSDEIIENIGERKLSKAEKRSLIFILFSVALWFFGYNAISSKYSVYATNILDKDYNLTLLIAQGAAILSYIPVGIIASKFGRKKTILVGVLLLTTAFVVGAFITPNTSDIAIYLTFFIAGVAWATINVNSFPMVVEMSSGSNVGKYTGYYYTASMAAQILTPILSGLLMDTALGMRILFPYGAVFAGLAFITMLFVKHGDSTK